MAKNPIIPMSDPYRESIPGFKNMTFPTEASEDAGMKESNPNSEYKIPAGTTKVRTGLGD